jgi:arylsulfatase A-like enzyme
MRFHLLLVLAAALAGASVRAAAARAPNVIVILADDLGWGDLSCQGSPTISTPRIDRMAREGVRFTDAYSAAPFCSPSRAALLTGRLPARCGLPYVLFPAEHHGLPAAEITLAQLLKQRGYATACVGKWHLGADDAFRPQRRGFDEFYGLPYSNDSTEWAPGEAFMQVMGLQPLPLMDGTKIVEAPVDQTQLTQRYTKRAVEFIRANRAKPFFLYLAHTMPHVPQHASAEFAGKSRGGLYGDVVEEIDWSTGVILDALRDLGIDEQTLVIFTSDNGAPVRAGGAAEKKVKAPAGAGGRFPGRSFVGSNGPLRGGKGTTLEGGIREPFIARWPSRIPAGRVVADPISLMDIFPTAAALAAAALPPDRVYDGRDITALLTQTNAKPAEPRLFFHYFGYQPQAVRKGAWKLLLADVKPPEPRPASLWWEHQPRVFETQHRVLHAPELYDLTQDIGEKHNVAAANPAIVEELTRLTRDFDADLQGNRRPMEFVAGPTPPPPGTRK